MRGTLIEAGRRAKFGYPGLILDPDEAPIEGFVFESRARPNHWHRLDAFEGPGYRRIAADVWTAEGVFPASIYVIADPTELRSIARKARLAHDRFDAPESARAIGMATKGRRTVARSPVRQSAGDRTAHPVGPDRRVHHRSQ